MSIRIAHNPNYRHSKCGYTYYDRDGKQRLFSWKHADCALSTYIPVLYSGVYGQHAYLAYLAHHIAAPSNYCKATVDWFRRFYETCPFIWRQDPNAISVTDPASKRWFCGFHTFRNTIWGRHPICEDNDENRRFIDSLLNAILKYGHEVLGVPLSNLVLTRADIRGYDRGARMGGHNDSPTEIHLEKSCLRTSIKAGGDTDVVFDLRDYHPDTMTQPNVFQDEYFGRSTKPELRVKCRNAFSVYACSPFASGFLPLGINGDKNDGSFIVAYHRVDPLKGSKSTTMVIDFFFDSVEDTMAALEKIRQEPFQLDFNGTYYVDKYINVSNSFVMMLGQLCYHITMSLTLVCLSLSSSATVIKNVTPAFPTAATTANTFAAAAADSKAPSADSKRKATRAESLQTTNKRGRLTDWYKKKN